MTGPGPGWYDDPSGAAGTHRWWNGAAWTGATRTVDAAPPVSAAPPLPSSVPQDRRTPSPPAFAGSTPAPARPAPTPSAQPQQAPHPTTHRPYLAAEPGPVHAEEPASWYPGLHVTAPPPAAVVRQPRRRRWLVPGAAAVVVLLVLAAGGGYLWHRSRHGPAEIPGTRYTDSTAKMSYVVPTRWSRAALPSTPLFGFVGASSLMRTTPYPCANGDECFRGFVIAGVKTTGSAGLGLDFFATEYGQDMASASGNGDSSKAVAQGSATRTVGGRPGYTATWRITPDDRADAVDLGRIAVWRDTHDAKTIYFFWETWDLHAGAPSQHTMDQLLDSIRLSS